MSYFSINRVVLVGRLTREPELRALPSGTSVCGLRIAVNSMRMEKAYRSWGHDIGVEDTPIEAGLAWGASLAWRMDSTAKTMFTASTPTFHDCCAVPALRSMNSNNVPIIRKALLKSIEGTRRAANRRPE